MAFSAKDILFYSEKLYESALQSMADGDFRMADRYAMCAYSAANLLSNDPDLGELKDQVHELRDAAFQLSSQAYSSSRAEDRSIDRMRMLEPRMSGTDEIETEHFKAGMNRLAKEVVRRRKSS